jgi:hypothetical protein
MAAKTKLRTPAQRRQAGIAIAISAALVAAAEIDLHRRPASEIRGDKRVWRLVCLNGLGAVSYLVWGRRRG